MPANLAQRYAALPPLQPLRQRGRGRGRGIPPVCLFFCGTENKGLKN